MTSAEFSAARNRLRDAVAVLASPPEAQREWLRRIGTFPVTDELAIEFDDWAQLLPQLGADDLVDDESDQAIQRLAAALDRLQAAFGTDPDKWQASALDESPEWETVREAAGPALVAFVIHDSAWRPQPTMRQPA